MKAFLTMVVSLLFLLCTISPCRAEGPGPDKRAGDVWIDPATGMEFVWVPGGCFMMGSNSGQAIERPVHKVCLDGFWMGRYEVTQDQWETVMGNNPSEFKKCGGDCPVESVTWNSCQKFIQKLGPGYSLPTEAQWEYAARSMGKNEIYAGGDNPDTVAWHTKNSGTTPHGVGTKLPNGLGIFDMSGNVWEWCQDWAGPYDGSEQTNPSGPPVGKDKVIRGGGWYSMPDWLRTTDRGRHDPGFAYLLLGLRLVKE